MNITKEIATEMGVKSLEILKSIPEIQIYANHNTNQYQWRDSRFANTTNVWDNPSYDTRGELKIAMFEYLNSKK